MTAPATTVSRTNRPTATAALTLPSMPDTSPALQATLRQVLERLAVLDGQRGDDLDAAVTRRELVDAGIASVKRGAGGVSIESGYDNSEWTNIPYLDSMPTPPTPTFKTGIGVNFLFWELPNARGVGATEVFRRTNDLDGAIIASPVGAMYADLPVEFATTYFYKIRYVSELGVAGDWSPEVEVLSEVDPSYVIEVISGQLNESSLAQELRERITTGGSIDQSIAAEILARTQAITAEAQTRAQAIASEQAARTEAIAAEVQARTQAITAEAQARGTAITNEATLRSEGDSQLAQNIETLTAVVDGNIAAIQTEQTARADADSALSTRIDTLTTTVDGNTAAITSEATARVDADGALSSRIDTLGSTVGNNSALIVAETEARVTADNAITSRIDTLTSTVDGNTAAIVSEATTRAAEDVALSEMLDSLTAKMDDTYALMTEQIRVNATGDAATVNDLALALARIAASESAITSEQNIRATVDNALGERIDALTATVGENTAAITSEAKARTYADSALGSRIDAVITTVGENAAAITAEVEARADADSALSTRIDTLTSTVNGNQSSLVQNYYTKADADSAISQASQAAITSANNNTASLLNNYYTKTAADGAITEATTTALSKVVTTDANGNVVDLSAAVKSKVTTEADKVTGQAIAKLSYKAQSGNKVAGFGLSNDGTVSEFAINADKFYLLQGTATPFSVVNGVAYFNTAMIKDASISTAKIANLDATVATIARANIFDAEVGGKISSSNYDGKLKKGWAVHQDGGAEFYGNNVVFGGKLEVRRAGSGAGVDITNDGIKVYDASGVLRVVIGKLN